MAAWQPYDPIQRTSFERSQISSTENEIWLRRNQKNFGIDLRMMDSSCRIGSTIDSSVGKARDVSFTLWEGPRSSPDALEEHAPGHRPDEHKYAW